MGRQDAGATASVIGTYAGGVPGPYGLYSWRERMVTVAGSGFLTEDRGRRISTIRPPSGRLDILMVPP